MRVIDDAGSCARILKPLKLPVYDPGSRPDAVTCAGCLIIVNDRSDGNPRVSLELSNGASWDRVALGVDVGAQHRQIDLVPMVTQAVRDMLPVLSHAPQSVVIEHKPLPPEVSTLTSSQSDDVKVLAQALLEMSDHCRLLEERVWNLEHGTIAEVRVEAA